MSRDGTRIQDIGNVEVEHLLGLVSGQPLVKVRVINRTGAPVALGQMSPEDARSIASHLLDAAARSEYELDLVRGAALSGVDRDVAVRMVALVRDGERSRHEEPTP